LHRARAKQGWGWLKEIEKGSWRAGSGGTGSGLVHEDRALEASQGAKTPYKRL
jgi:hypothetical protein